MTEILTPATMWSEFNENLELNTRLFKRRNLDGIKSDEFFIDGYRQGNSVTRAYCVVAYPETKGPFPAVLVINEIKSGIERERLYYWAARGYIAVGVDYAGTEKNGNTIYPEVFCACDLPGAPYLRSVETVATHSPWFNYAFSTRCAINYLSTLSIYDGKGVYLYSIRDADKIALMTAVDRRVKCSAVIFGGAWESMEDETETLESGYNKEKYFAAIAPQSHLPNISAPLLLVQGTNSLTTDMNKSCEILNRAGNLGASTFVLIPRVLDAMPICEEQIALKWFVTYNEAKAAPTVNVKIINGSLYAAFEGSSDVSVHYARGNVLQPMKNWCNAAAKHENNELLAEIEVVNNGEPITVVCNTTVDCCETSSRLFTINPDELSQVKNLSEKSKIIYGGARDIAGFIPFSPLEKQTLKFFDSHPLTVSEGPMGVKGVCGTAFSTCCLSDSVCLFGANSALTFDVHSDTEQTLNVVLTTGWGVKPVMYTYSVKLAGGDFWEKITASCSSFKSPQGKMLSDLDCGSLLTFLADGKIILNNLRFT